MRTITSTVEIFYVDDSADDQLLAVMALEATNRAHDIRMVDSAVELWTALTARVENGHQLPDALVVDLKMPMVNGHQLLGKLAADPELGRIPLVVLSTSSDPRDVLRADEQGVRLYEVKPSRFDELVATFHRILDLAERT